MISTFDPEKKLLSYTRFTRRELPWAAGPVTRMPVWLLTTRFQSAAVGPPTMLFDDVSWIKMPGPELPRFAVPEASVPMKLPRMVLALEPKEELNLPR